MLKLFLNGKSDAVLKVRSILQSIREPLPNEVQESSRLIPNINGTEQIISSAEKFEPKFGSSGVLSGGHKYSPVIISNMVHPGHLYIQFVDQEFPLYHQMQEDLLEEFGSATNQSLSYCPTPAAGIIFRYLFIRKS